MKKLSEILQGFANEYSLKKEVKQETLRTLKLALLSWELTKDSFDDYADDRPEFMAGVNKYQGKIATEIKVANITPSLVYNKDRLKFTVNAQKLEYESIISAVRDIEAKDGEEREELRNNFTNKYLGGYKEGYTELADECGNFGEKIKDDDDLWLIGALADEMADNNYKSYRMKQQDDMVTRVIAGNHLVK